MQKTILFFLMCYLLSSCHPESPLIQQLTFTEIASPSTQGGEPNLFSTKDGELFLSWVQSKDDTTHSLYYAQLENEQWVRTKRIAQGNNWFVNWADFPSLALFDNPNRNIAAHWLQKRAEGTYDYDVRIAISQDQGASWNPSFVPHRDSIAAEHGFVTLLPLPNGRMFATWLDGRNTKGEKEGHGGHDHGGGAMTLRSAEFDPTGKLYHEHELDSRVCDCCQTDAALTSNGPVVVYRDRSEEEIRDIYIVRQVNGKWTAPKAVFDDEWLINGCPVNGPAIAANGDRLAIAWFTMQEDQGQVKVAFSDDAGANFSQPIQIDEGDPMGRVDVLFTESQEAVISWIEQDGEASNIMLAQVTSNGTILQKIAVDHVDNSRKSGFPILEKTKDSFYLVWTLVEETSKLKIISFNL